MLPSAADGPERRSPRPTFGAPADRPGPSASSARPSSRSLGRRRLIRYLVQADLHKKGADTLLGNLWWVLDPLLQMVVYVVLVSVIFQRGGPDYPLFIFARSCPGSGSSRRSTTASRRCRARSGSSSRSSSRRSSCRSRRSIAGIVNFAFGLIPLVALMLLFYRDRHRRSGSCCIPVVAVVQFVFTLALAVLRRRAQRLLPRHRQRGPPRPAAVVLPVAGAVLARPADACDHASSRSSSSCCSLNPCATLFTAYRAVIYDGHAPRLGAPWSGPARVARPPRARRRSSSSASSRRSPRSCDGRRRRASSAAVPAADAAAMRRSPSTCATSASSTACASRARRRSATRS